MHPSARELSLLSVYHVAHIGPHYAPPLMREEPRRSWSTGEQAAVAAATLVAKSNQARQAIAQRRPLR